MILETKNITKSFGSREVLNGITFSIDKGNITGIVGENGSGKTTLLKILTGIIKPNSGSLKLNGTIGYCPQESLVFPKLTVLENFRYFASAYKLAEKGSNKIKDQVEFFLDYFKFKQFKNDQTDCLSGGTLQKLNLSIALMHNPDLLILDEPYSGFDWETYNRFWEFALQYRKDGFSILLVTHLLTDTSQFDIVYQIKKGYLT